MQMTVGRSRMRRLWRMRSYLHPYKYHQRQSGTRTDWPRQIFRKNGLSRIWSRRPRPPSVEVVVHADAGDVFPGMPSVSDLDLWGYRRSETSGRRVTAEVKVKVLKLGRPIVREHPFGDGARGPADLGLADTGRRDEGSEARVVRFEVICRSVNMAICQTARPIEQQVGRDGDAETAPHRAEP